MFAVKHYLRGEDGLDWDDYLDVLPTSFLKLGHSDRPASENPSLASSLVAPLSTNSPTTANGIGNGRETPDATKRIRVKRSKHNLSRRTTLLEGSHWHGGYSAIDVHADITMPLPLMYEYSHYLFRTHIDSSPTVSHTKSPVNCSPLNEKAFWRLSDQPAPTRCNNCSRILLSTDSASLIGFVQGSGNGRSTRRHGENCQHADSQIVYVLVPGFLASQCPNLMCSLHR